MVETENPNAPSLKFGNNKVSGIHHIFCCNVNKEIFGIFLGHFQEDVSSTRMPVIAVTPGPSESDTGNGDFDWPRYVRTSVHPRSQGLSSSLSLEQGREEERS